VPGPLPGRHLPERQRIVAVMIPLAWIIAAAACAVHTAPGPGSWYLMAVLLACAVLTGRPRHQDQSPAGISVMWELPAVALAPPVFAFIAPGVAFAAGWRRNPRLPRWLDAAAAGLADGAVSAAFHAIAPPQPPPGTRAGDWLLAVAAAGVIRLALIRAVFLPAAGGERLPRLPADRDMLRGGLAELCAAILVTCSAIISPLCVLLAVPLATPLLRSARHAQLVRDARTDARTGLLNAAAWQDDAAAEITRAVRARLPLAMILLDIDHFKAVNDTHGHLAGDQVLRAVAGIIRSQLRDYDIAGRYGGEEFTVLLPHTQPGQARRIAERLRMAVAAAHLTASAGTGPATPVRVTVSAGVASLAEYGPGLQALIAAADAALYDAKTAGRNRVRACRGQPPGTSSPAGNGNQDGCGTLVAEATPHR
jgi:diguanylate cyclase (GGDEF)-like protein